MSERHLVDPTPELPDNTLIDNVRFPTGMRNMLAAAALKTVGEVCETADEKVAELSGPWAGVGRKPWKDLGPAVVRWGQAPIVTPTGEAEWLRIELRS
jgi:hypothetical protein